MVSAWMMDRPAFLVALGGASFTAPLAVDAQMTPTAHRIGRLSSWMSWYALSSGVLTRYTCALLDCHARRRHLAAQGDSVVPETSIERCRVASVNAATCGKQWQYGCEAFGAEDGIHIIFAKRGQWHRRLFRLRGRLNE